MFICHLQFFFLAGAPRPATALPLLGDLRLAATLSLAGTRRRTAALPLPGDPRPATTFPLGIQGWPPLCPTPQAATTLPLPG